jgi:hypothetical protein
LSRLKGAVAIWNEKRAALVALFDADAEFWLRRR